MVLIRCRLGIKRESEIWKKRSEKRIAPYVLELLKAMFIAGQEDHSKRNSAKEIFDDLSQMAEEGILSPEEVPSKQTIQSWIGRYSATNKKEIARLTKVTDIAGPSNNEK
ncbi:hypothetical protein C2G38_2040270 [Gigaspora rosea]|uniref:Uncharacterized protein n=1 Tax=Gigaspora rosea TaxID=44941 RepID=A0A397UYA0_9GLOM|nr:hypothetical protein C2G38_2040270 [Gigaspora rosea]